MKHEGIHIVAHRMGKNGAFVLAQCVYIPFESFLRLNSFFFSLFVCGYCCVYGIALVVARERERESERAQQKNMVFQNGWKRYESVKAQTGTRITVHFFENDTTGF